MTIAHREDLTREEVAKIEIGHTEIRPGTARLLLVALLCAIGVTPLVQRVSESGGEDVVTAWSQLSDLLEAPPARFEGLRQEGASRFDALVGANREALRTLEAFEDAIDDEAVLGRLLRPPVQRLLARWLGVGNEQAYIGRGGWLFYRQDVDHLTGPGFLDPAQLVRRARGGRAWELSPQPDPRPAIVDFARGLEARGVALVVVPTPVKPTIHPERVAWRYDGAEAPLHNPSYQAFLADLERRGVRVLDVAPELKALAEARGRPVYLATDTHWRPETVEVVAARLARYLVERVGLPVTPAVAYRAEATEITAAGDITQMLDLPVDQALYPPEAVTIRRILDPAAVDEPGDGVWRPSRSADVLLLGDSFTNIYSLGSMGWGDAAGLAEQLSFELQRPVDRLVQNDQGAFATRALLRRGLGGPRDRLVGKRVVVYQFAVRELSAGDWRLIDLSPPAP